MEPVNPKIREELARTREQFRALLTAEQQQHFDELIKLQQQHPRDLRHPGNRPPETVSNLPPSGEPPH
jgi:Spy/CpxP family protein refolding chaperone